ncbi:hypothetical protein Q3G72_013738 [Acer saccharum]|nr:hypothetical protein Q3G72_013738 [Acer saccharum]
MTALLSSISHSRASIPRNGVSSLSKLFTTSHPDSKSKDSMMAETDRARLREFLHGKCKSDKAKELFSEMKGNGILADVVTYTSLIHGLCCVGDWEEAKSLFIEMLNQGVQPTTVTFNVLLDELCKNGKMDEANKLCKLMIQRGKLEKANDLLLGMEEKGCIQDVVTFATLMRGFIQNNEKSNVVELLHKMVKRNLIPNASIVSMVIDLLVNDENYRECLNSLPSFLSKKPTRS